VHLRHLEVMRAQLLLTDKIPFMFSRGHGQIADNFELIRIAHGLTAEQFPGPSQLLHRHQYQFSHSSWTSRWPDGIVDTAAAGQVLIITPLYPGGARWLRSQSPAR